MAVVLLLFYIQCMLSYFTISMWPSNIKVKYVSKRFSLIPPPHMHHWSQPPNISMPNQYTH